MAKVVTNRLRNFIESEKSGGLVLFVCTIAWFNNVLKKDPNAVDIYLNDKQPVN